MRAPDHQSGATATGRAVAALAEELDRVAPRCALALSAAVRRSVRVAVDTSSAVAAADLGAEEGRTWFRVGAPGQRCAAVSFEAPAVVRLADVVMGGQGAPSPARPPTTLELVLVADSLATVLACLADVLATHGVASTVVQPLAGPTELALDGQLVRTTLGITLDTAEVSADLLIPLVGHAAPAGSHDFRPDADLVQSLASVPLSVAVRFPPVRLRACDLDDLEVGDLIRLEQPGDPSVVGEVGGRALFRGRTGRSGRRLAVQVLEIDETGEVETRP